MKTFVGDRDIAIAKKVSNGTCFLKEVPQAFAFDEVKLGRGIVYSLSTYSTYGDTLERAIECIEELENVEDVAPEVMHCLITGVFYFATKI